MFSCPSTLEGGQHYELSARGRRVRHVHEAYKSHSVPARGTQRFTGLFHHQRERHLCVQSCADRHEVSPALGYLSVTAHRPPSLLRYVGLRGASTCGLGDWRLQIKCPVVPNVPPSPVVMGRAIRLVRDEGVGPPSWRIMWCRDGRPGDVRPPDDGPGHGVRRRSGGRSQKVRRNQVRDSRRRRIWQPSLM